MMGRRRRRSVADFEEEIRSHLDHEADALQAGGLTRPEAMAAARARFGDVTRAVPPGAAPTGSGWPERLRRHVTHAFRTLRREPAFAAIAILTLTVGIGMNSAIFTFMYSLTVRGLPLPDADRIVTVHQAFEGMPMSRFGEAGMTVGEGSRRAYGSSDRVSWPEFQAYADGAGTRIDLAGFAGITATLAGEPARQVAVVASTCGYFRILGAPPVVGRGFDDADCRAPGESPVAVLGHAFWQTQLGGDPGVVGTTIRLNRTSFTVVGVAAPGFTGTDAERPDLWIPVTMQPALGSDRLSDPDLGWLAMVGRLEAGATREGAAALLTAIGRSRDASYPGRHTTILAYDATRVGGPVNAPYVRILQVGAFALGALILLIACLNVASLMLARAPARQRDVRIRRALGASRADVMGQLLAESSLLALAGGVSGLALSFWLPPVIAARLLPARLEVPLTPDLHVVGYALAVSFVAAIAFGLAPSFETSRVDLASALRGDTSGGGRGPRTFRLRQALVGAQVAGSLLLLVLAALFGRGLVRAQHTSPGFRVDHVYGFMAGLEDQGYGPDRAMSFYDDLKTRVAGLPGVESVALSSQFPLRGQESGNFMRDPNATMSDVDEGLAYDVNVSPDYFAALDIPILRGTGLPAGPVEAGEPLPAVIGEAMARRFWPDRDPVGRIFAAPTGRARRVVGVVRDALVGGLDSAERPFFFSAIPLHASPGVLLVHTRGELPVTADVLRLAHQLDSGVLVSVISLQDVFASKLEPARLAAVAAGGLGLLALLLALVGVYGVIAFLVSQRSHEFGVRFALGADRRDIRRLVLRQGAFPLACGLVGGVLLAAGVARVVRGQLYGFAYLDPIAFVGVTVLLAGAAVAAMLHPARRATSVSPSAVLRRD